MSVRTDDGQMSFTYERNQKEKEKETAEERSKRTKGINFLNFKKEKRVRGKLEEQRPQITWTEIPVSFKSVYYGKQKTEETPKETQIQWPHAHQLQGPD